MVLGANKRGGARGITKGGERHFSDHPLVDVQGI